MLIAFAQALIEAKIFREDELESELKRLRDKSSSANQASTQHASRSEKSSTSSMISNGSKSSTSSTQAEDNPDACELCGELGHDIEGCPIMSPRDALAVTDDLFCENCETMGKSLSFLLHFTLLTDNIVSTGHSTIDWYAAVFLLRENS